MFFTKKFQQQNIGQILKEARYRTGLSLKIISKHIHINYKFLEALEKNDWSKLPGEIYAKNFLKDYCNFLKIKIPDIKNIKFYMVSEENYHKKIFTQKIKLSDLFNLPKTIKLSFFIFFTLIFLVYIVWQINQITAPPIIEIFYPQTNLISNNNVITVSGKANSEVKIKINQEDVILLPDNSFAQVINLIPGINNLLIEGKTKYSKTRTIERKIIFEPAP
ncbi:MAG TPA: helix-turn-helix transcriptional regulator [bacterium]|nr:helix-turn-helix transcriptional regulator [bacterium]